MHNPTNDPLSGWNDPQPWYTTSTGRTEPPQPPRRRTVAAHIGRVLGYAGFITLAYLTVLVVTA